MLTILNETHIELFVDLKRNNPGLWGLDENYEAGLKPDIFFKNVLLGPDRFTVGWIEDDKLLSIASLKENLGWSDWVFNYYSSRKTNIFNYENTKANLVISELFHESLRRKLTACLMISRADYQISGSGSNFNSVANNQMSSRAKERIARMTHRQLPIITQFTWVDECYIPANTISKYYSELFFNRTWPFDLMVRRAYLKQEYRDNSIIMIK